MIIAFGLANVVMMLLLYYVMGPLYFDFCQRLDTKIINNMLKTNLDVKYEVAGSTVRIHWKHDGDRRLAVLGYQHAHGLPRTAIDAETTGRCIVNSRKSEGTYPGDVVRLGATVFYSFHLYAIYEVLHDWSRFGDPITTTRNREIRVAWQPNAVLVTHEQMTPQESEWL